MNKTICIFSCTIAMALSVIFVSVQAQEQADASLEELTNAVTRSNDVPIHNIQLESRLGAREQQQILAYAIASLEIFNFEDIDLTNFYLLSRDKIKNILIYRVAGKQQPILGKDDYALLQHLLINAFSRAYHIVECLECTQRRIILQSGKLSYQSLITDNHELKQHAAQVGADAILLWGINNQQSKTGVFFRLVDIKTDKVVFSQQELLEHLQNLHNYKRKHLPYKKQWLELSAQITSMNYTSYHKAIVQNKESSILPFVGVNYNIGYLPLSLILSFNIDALLFNPPLCKALQCNAYSSSSSPLSFFKGYRLLAGVKRSYARQLYYYGSFGILAINIPNVPSEVSSIYQLGVEWHMLESNIIYNLGINGLLQTMNFNYQDYQVNIEKNLQLILGIKYRW
jgi:hypothetical protein